MKRWTFNITSALSLLLLLLMLFVLAYGLVERGFQLLSVDLPGQTSGSLVISSRKRADLPFRYIRISIHRHRPKTGAIWNKADFSIGVIDRQCEVMGRC